MIDVHSQSVCGPESEHGYAAVHGSGAGDEGEGSSHRTEHASWPQLVSLEMLPPAGALRSRVPNAANSSWRVSQTDVCEET